MSLDVVRDAKERGWKVVLVPEPGADENTVDENSFYVLLTPSGKPVKVSDKEGYGSTWGDFSEPEAWQRLPDEV